MEKKKKKRYQFLRAKDVSWKRRKNIHRAGVVFYFFDDKSDKSDKSGKSGKNDSSMKEPITSPLISEAVTEIGTNVSSDLEPHSVLLSDTNVEDRMKQRSESFDNSQKQIYFILGLDRGFSEWTDFGGSLNAGENGAEAAYREMKEETLDIFNDLLGEGMKTMIETSHTIIEPNMVIIFMPLPLNLSRFLEYRQRFLNKVKEMNNIVENIEIQAFEFKDFEALVNKLCTKQTDEKIMYEKTACLIEKKMSDLKHWSIPKNYTSAHSSTQSSPRH